jgi:hypothetical protein
MIHIVIHILPQEINQLEQLLVHLKKSSKWVSFEDFTVEVVLNNKLIDWSTSKLDEQFFIDKFNFLETLTSSWCLTKFEISDGTILGCNDIRRRALRTSQADYIMYLDTDNISSESLLYHIKHYTDYLLTQEGYNILVPEVTRLWDDSWDVITNSNHYQTEASHEKYFNIDPYNIDFNPDNVSINPINTFKFAGWGTCIPTKLREIIDIPNSLGSYGLDDTFIMIACNILKDKGYPIQQYNLQNEIIIENNKFRFNPYKNYLTMIDKKEEFKTQAHTNFNQELQKYLNL